MSKTVLQEDINKQEIEKILRQLVSYVKDKEKSIKQKVIDAAQALVDNGYQPKTMISSEITQALKKAGVSHGSRVYVRSCLGEEYKEPYRRENSRKRVAVSKKKLDFGNGGFAKSQKFVTDKLESLTVSPLTKITKQQIKKEASLERMREIALFLHHKADIYKYGLEAANKRIQYLESRETTLPQLIK